MLDQEKKQNEIGKRLIFSAKHGDMDGVLAALNETPSPDYFQYAFERANFGGYLDIVRLLTTDKRTSPFIDIHVGFDWPARVAAIKGYLPLLRYYLTSPDLSDKVHVNANDGDLLARAVSNSQEEVIDYLLSSPELSEHADPALNHGEALWGAFWGRNNKTLFKLLDRVDNS